MRGGTLRTHVSQFTAGLLLGVFVRGASVSGEKGDRTLCAMTMMWSRNRAVSLIGVLSLFLSHSPVDAACPNSCSGHGSCGTDNICGCDTKWAVVADCSRMECPTAVSWGTKPFLPSQAHVPVECAGVGTCNYATGVCSCPPGFDGQGCERLSCPNNCNNQGTCQTVKNVGYAYGADTQTLMNSGGDGFGPIYNNWDKDSATMCV